MPVVAEKLAATAVMIPLRGTVNEKLDTPPKLMVFPIRLMLEAEFPTPIKLAVSAKPTAVVARVIVVPEAKGMIAPFPAGQ